MNQRSGREERFGGTTSLHRLTLPVEEDGFIAISMSYRAHDRRLIPFDPPPMSWRGITGINLPGHSDGSR